jgi:hypothetical protein
MIHLFKAVCLVGLFIAMQGCSPKGSPIVQLGAPRFVPQSQPDSVIETGIGQDPTSGGIFLQWYNDVNAAGYKVFRADSTNLRGDPINFRVVGNVITSGTPSDTSMVDVLSVQAGVKYYYFVRAYKSDGALSDPSDTVSYTLEARPILYYPTANSSISLPFSFFDWNDYAGGGYTVVRVMDNTSIPGSIIWVSGRFRANVHGSDHDPNINFNSDGRATGRILAGHIYQWRVDKFDVDSTGRMYEGARSAWGTFTVK